MEIVHVYTKKRSEFGRPCHFVDRPAELTVNILPQPSLMNNFIQKNPIQRAVQVGAEQSEHEVNTERYEVESTGVNHTEGGWPKDINPQEVEQTMRYRKKIEKDEAYISTIQNLGNVIEHSIRQNNAIDIYEEYFDDITTEEMCWDPPYAHMLSDFRDPDEMLPNSRTVSHLSWLPDGGSRIAAAYSLLQFQAYSHETTVESYIWNIEMPNKPEMTLVPFANLITLEYNPKDPFILLGGAYSGQIAYWDTRKGSSPVEATPVENSHKDPVYKTIWQHSKTGTECFTCSTDGYVLWWDIRKFSEPTDKLSLDISKRDANHPRALSATSMEYEPTMPTRFMVGTEESLVLSCNRKAKTATEKIVSVYSSHSGAVCAVQRNPYFPKVFLTVGDWSAKVWSEENKISPVVSASCENARLSDGCWSPTKASVFFTTRTDGYLDAWDLLFKHSTPTLSVRVGDEALHSIRMQTDGRLVAVGSHSGLISLLQVSPSLHEGHRNDRSAMATMLERETRREKIMDLISREHQLKMKRQPTQEGLAMTTDSRPSTPAASPSHRDLAAPESEEELQRKAEAEFAYEVGEERKRLRKNHSELLTSLSEMQIDVSNIRTTGMDMSVPVTDVLVKEWTTKKLSAQPPQ